MAYGSGDFGGGYSKAAFINTVGRAEVVIDPHNQRSMPTAVYVGTDGSVLVGKDAIEMGRAYPQNLAVDFKRFLGTDTAVLRDLRAKDLAVHVFSALKVQIEQQSGEVIDAIVLTQPANNTNEQTKDLLDAASKAGLTVSAVISEPAAAAFASAIRRLVGDRHVFVACIDLGSTTLDVTILEIKDGVATPVATEGLPQLGGSDFTRVVEGMLLAKLGTLVGKPISKEKLSAEQRLELFERAESAKIGLSRQPLTRVTLSAGGRAHAVEITKQEYEEAVKPLMQAVLECVDKAFASKGMNPSEMEMVVLTGAPMLSDFVRATIDQHLGISCKVASDPSSSVAEGAALHAASLVQSGGRKANRVLPEYTLRLQESTSHDIGVVVVEDAGTANARAVCALLLPKGTPIPCPPQAQFFRLERDNQTDCKFQFVQGPDGAPASQCAPMGDASLSQLPPEPKRSPRIRIDIAVNAKSIATITITDLVSGKAANAEIRVPSSGSSTP